MSGIIGGIYVYYDTKHTLLLTDTETKVVVIDTKTKEMWENYYKNEEEYE